MIRSGGNEQHFFMDTAHNFMDISIRKVSLEGEGTDT